MPDDGPQPARRFEWERVLRRCVLPLTVRFVGLILASYADAAGGSIRPGEPRLAAVCGMGRSTVRRHVATLVELGLIERVTSGGGRGREGVAAMYRLTIPVDLLDTVPMLGPDEQLEAAEVENPRLF